MYQQSLAAYGPCASAAHALTLSPHALVLERRRGGESGWRPSGAGRRTHASARPSCTRSSSSSPGCGPSCPSGWRAPAPVGRAPQVLREGAGGAERARPGRLRPKGVQTSLTGHPATHCRPSVTARATLRVLEGPCQETASHKGSSQTGSPVAVPTGMLGGFACKGPCIQSRVAL